MNEAPETRLTLATSPKRYLDDAVAAWIGGADGNAPDGVEALAVFRRQAHDHREVAVAAFLEQISGGLAADGRLQRRIDVARGKPIAGRAQAVDIDFHRRLAERIEHGKIGDAAAPCSSRL